MAEDPPEADGLEKLVSLRDRGELSEEEFQAQMARLLGGGQEEAAASTARRDLRGGVAEFHVLQNQAMVVLHLPFDAAVGLLVPILREAGSAKVKSSSSFRLTAMGTCRTGGRVRYKLTIVSSEAASSTLAQFSSNKPDELEKMLATQVITQLNSQPPPPRSQLRPLSRRKNVRLKFRNYDGGLPAHIRPEAKGGLSLPRDAPQFVLTWRRPPTGTPKVTVGELARYAVTTEPASRGSHLVVRDRVDPHVVAHLDLPGVRPAKFERLLATKIRGHAMTCRPMYRILNYNGGLPAHPRVEGLGTLLLVRSLWVVRFPGTEQLFHGLITDDSIKVTKTGPSSCRVAITVPQVVGGQATFHLVETPAEVLSTEFATRKALEGANRGQLSKKDTKWVLDATRRFQQDPSKAVATKTSRPNAAAGAVLAFLLVAGLAIGIPIALTSNNSGISNNSSSGTIDNCPAGYGYLDVSTNECYQGSGPDANNAAGNGAVATCPSGYPYFNAGTGKCWTSVPSASGSGGTGGSIGEGTSGSNGGGTGGSNGGGPAQCGLKVNTTYNTNGATIHVKVPTTGCYIHVTEGTTTNDLPPPGPYCTSSLGAPPSTISNIVRYEYSSVTSEVYSTSEDSTVSVTEEAYTLTLEDGTVITITGCHFGSYNTTELNHLTNYDYIG